MLQLPLVDDLRGFRKKLFNFFMEELMVQRLTKLIQLWLVTLRSRWWIILLIVSLTKQELIVITWGSISFDHLCAAGTFISLHFLREDEEAISAHSVRAGLQFHKIALSEFLQTNEARLCLARKGSLVRSRGQLRGGRVFLSCRSGGVKLHTFVII